MALDFTPKDCTITLTRRDNPELVFKFKNPAGHPNEGEPIDLTGNTYKLAVNPAADGSGVDLFEIANSNVPDFTGEVRFAPSIANMTQAPDTYFYDLQQTDTGGKVRTLVNGKFVILPDIAD